MEYKVLVKLYLPEIEQSYDMYIPVNKTVSQVIVLFNQVVNDITANLYPIRDDLKLVNRRNNKVYDYSTVIRDTDISNGTELVMF